MNRFPLVVALALVAVGLVATMQAPQPDPQPAKQAEQEYRELVDHLPRDGDQPYVTVIGASRNDVQSMYLRQWMHSEPWLSWLRQNTHYREIVDGPRDAFYRDVLQPYVPVLPAVVICKPPDADTNQGQVAYLAAGNELPSTASDLAYQVSEALRAHYATFYGVEFGDLLADCPGPECRPQQPTRQKPLPNKWPPEKPSVPWPDRKLPFDLDFDLPNLGGGGSDKMALWVALAGGALLLVVFLRSRR